MLEVDEIILTHPVSPPSPHLKLVSNMEQKETTWLSFILKHVLTYPVGFVLVWLAAQQERSLPAFSLAIAAFCVFIGGTIWAIRLWPGSS